MTNTEAAAVDSTAAVSEQGADVAPEKVPAKKGARQKKNAPKGQRAAKGARPATTKDTKRTKKTDAGKKAAGKPADERANKKSEVVKLLQRSRGVTLNEIAELTSSQPHTIRGFISIPGAKGGYKIASEKNADGQRLYKTEE